MLKVSNRKIITLLSTRSLRAAKLRNIMAICAITLTSVLFTTLFTLGIGSIDAFQQATMRQSGGSGHAAIKYIDDATFEKIKVHPLVKEISYNRTLCDNVDNLELLKRHGELWYMDDIGLKQGFCQPTIGNRPIAENEIIADTKTLQLLNVPQEIGATVKLTLTIRGEQVERNFVLSGWWESDSAYNVSMLITSRAYVDAHQQELAYTFKEDNSYTGIINAYFMFDNTFSMQKKLDRVITESGYDAENEDAPNFVSSNLNWAYISAGMDGGDPTMIAALIVAALLIIFTGYLIIYNIFQISVLRDIRYYGLLKTIGTTGRQIKRIIRRQAAMLSLIGIPIGLILGYVVGSMFVPMVLSQTIYAGSTVNVSPNPVIFIGAALFSTITVWISTRKPGKIAARVSPVEAVKYTDSDVRSRKKNKQSTNGGKLPKMALANLGRNKKRTVLVFLSLSLSLVLLNSVFTISRGLDMDKYLSTFVDTDFLVAHADYFNYNYNSSENAVDEEVIRALESQTGFEEGGRLYNTIREQFTVEDPDYSNDYNRGEDELPFSAIFGLDDLPLERLEVIEGELDMEKLKLGGYILEGIHTDDFGHPNLDSAKFDIGDKVILHNNRIKNIDTGETEYTTQEYEVMAKVLIKTFTNTDRRGWDYIFYLPSNVYLPLTYEKSIMSYAFNVKNDSEEKMEKFIKNHTETEAPLMNYDSKAVKVEEFKGMQNLVLSVGG